MPKTKRVEYRAANGMLQLMEIPDNAPQDHAKFGVLVGPPDLSSLKLPKAVEVRLNNELYHRRMLSVRDVKTRTSEVVAALQAAYAVDATKVINLYLESENVSG